MQGFQLLQALESMHKRKKNVKGLRESVEICVQTKKSNSRYQGNAFLLFATLKAQPPVLV